MNKTELARELGISRQMLHRLAGKGMPTDSLDAAIKWRRENLDATQTKGWRMDGNPGVKRDEVDLSSVGSLLNDGEDNLPTYVLTQVIPNIWFSQPGWLAGALREYGIAATPEQVIKAQRLLFAIYADVAADFLEKEYSEMRFVIPDTLLVKQGSELHPKLIERLSQILSKEKTA